MKILKLAVGTLLHSAWLALAWTGHVTLPLAQHSFAERSVATGRLMGDLSFVALLLPISGPK